LNRPGPWLSIVGIGEDGVDGLSPAARALIAQASLVVGGARHLKLVEPIIVGRTMAWPSPPQAAFPEIKARRFSPVCVVATGDPFFYGVGSLLAKEIPIDELICLPGPSAFSLAASRLGWPLQDCALVSLHGRRLETILPHLQPRARILALSWDGSTPEKLAELLTRTGIGDAKMIICEAMAGPRERIRTTSADGFDLGPVDPLNLVAIETPGRVWPRAASQTPGLPDDWFENDGQLTKREIRAVTLAALAPRRGELLWDVGSGSGSVAIEWILSSPASRAVAIERDEGRAARIARNAASLGALDLIIAHGSAPDAFADLPQPDAIFVGGGVSRRKLLHAAWSALPPGGRLVANAVTLAAQSELFEQFKRFGGDLRTIQISRVEQIGSLDALRPARAVMQWAAVKR
jgi:precorrin-6B C5,15-methyltransferase / cobalt-precorrin-6B C5,C15-methyltransferase